MNLKQFYQNHKVTVYMIGGAIALLTVYIITNQKGKRKAEKLAKEKKLMEERLLAEQKVLQDKLEKEREAKKEAEKGEKEALEGNKKDPVGKFAYAKKANTNLRSTPEVNDGFMNNRLGDKFQIGNKIGMIKKELKGYDQMTWYQIDVDTLPTAHKYWAKGLFANAYVRADVVNVK